MEIINLKNQIEIDFEKIINNKSRADDLMNQIEEIIEKINIKYNSLITNIKENHNIEIPIYLGIDSLQFQNKLYSFKFNNLKQLYNRIFNRIYADYYKIHKLIRKYISNNTTIPSIEIDITPYKDLDQDKYYNFEETIKIHNTINQYIQSLNDIITKKSITIQPFLNSNKAGYAVSCYISEEETNIKIFTNKCLLFINYLTTFNQYHNNYLIDFLLHCRFMITTLKNDINFNCDNQALNIDEYFENDNVNNDFSNNNICNNDISNSNICNNDITDISNNIKYTYNYSETENSTVTRKIIIDEDLENDTNNQDIRTNLTIEDRLNIEINKKEDKNDNLLINDTEIDMSNNNYIKNHLLNNAANKKTNAENISLSIDQFELKKPDTHYMCSIF